MEYQYDITVTVGTYNPKWTKLKATLLSIVAQKNIKLQIVVSDDGSANPLHTEVRSLFEQIGFKDYKLVTAEKNEGTVCQFYSAICNSDSEYIKPISPGDLLYEDTVLARWLVFTKENDADITFGDAVFYNMCEEHLNIIRHKHHPQNTKFYKNDSKFSYYDKVINYIFLGDGISGATKIAKKEILLYYIGLLLHRVIYVEDYFIRLAVLDKRKILYFPDKVIWYEFSDGGISTTKESKWVEPLCKDNFAMYEICLEKWLEPDIKVKRWLLDTIPFSKLENPTRLNRVKRYLKHPSWLYWKVYGRLHCEYSPTDVDETFFKKCFE